jgi:exosortase A
MQSETLIATDRSFLLKAGLIAITLLSPLLIYFGTVQSMIAIWDRSDTFTHQYCILPISLWLIWRRRETLARMTPQPWWPALIALLGCGAAWLLGTLAGVQGVSQYALVATVILAALTLLGRRISWAIAFPLLFLLAAVPFGEIFINPLINFTADFTVTALRATGIPVLREGNSFVIPSGRWSVIEACSGVRYLIASVTLGLLYAYLTYKSRWRQLAFVVAAIIVPIVANGLRAYMIVMIGHLSGMTLAVGVDHLIYGWLFFGLVMFLMFWIGGFWHEGKTANKMLSGLQAAPTSTSATSSDAPVSIARLGACAICIVAAICVWPLYAGYIERASINPAAPDLNLGPNLNSALNLPRTDWQDSPAFTTWKPAFTPADAELSRYFRQGAQNVGLSIYFYRNQNADSKLISSANRILPEKNSAFNQVNSAVRAELLGNRRFAVQEEIIQNFQHPENPLLIWHCYWVDGRFVANDYLGKILLTKEMLSMRGDDGAALVVFASYADHPDQARQALRSFLNGNLPVLETMLAKTRKE